MPATFRRLASLPLLVAALVAAPSVRAAEGDVLLEAALENASVRLGDDVTLRLTVRNRSSGPVSIPVPRLARDSVSVGLAWGGQDRGTVTRIYGTFVEDEGAVRLRNEPTPRRDLGPGESLERSITFSAVVAGDVVLSASLGEPGPGRLAAAPLALEVLPKSGILKRLHAQVQTSRGTFTVELDGAAAPNSVTQFWRLARQGFYDGLPIHRVVPGLLVQGGDPRGNGTGGPGWYVPAESPSKTFPRGAFGLARGAHPDSAGSQWFVVSDREGHAASTMADAVAVLGRVVEGQELVDLLATEPVVEGTERPQAPPVVTEIRTVVR